MLAFAEDAPHKTR